MWYLILLRPDRPTATYALSEEYDEAADLVAYAKAHAGFPPNARLDQPEQAWLLPDPPQIEGLVEVDLSQVDGEAYRELERRGGQEHLKEHAAQALGQLDPDVLRQLLAEHAHLLKDA